MTKPNPEIVSKWKADREALKRDVLSSLGSPGELSTEALFSVYEAARVAFGAWAPPADWGDPEPYTWADIYERESQRAWEVMETAAEELASRRPDNLAQRHKLLALLADWHWHCDDNPNIARAILNLTMDSKHWRGFGEQKAKAVAS